MFLLFVKRIAKILFVFKMYSTGLQLIRQYCSDTSSEEDFAGFDDDEKNERLKIERFDNIMLAQCFTINAFPTENISHSVQDSDGSFLGDTIPSEGKLRKRTKKENLKAFVAKKRRLSHQIKLDCCGCKKQCSQHFSKDDRVEEHRRFWSLDPTGQSNFIRERVKRITVNRRTKNRHTEKLKANFFSFALKNSSNNSISVCRKFLLNSIGYADSCGYVSGSTSICFISCFQYVLFRNIIYRCMEFGDQPLPSNRGRYTRSIDKHNAVRKHIMTYNPTISHYRREHAPNRLYLPSDLTESRMHQHYLSCHELEVSYGFYCRVMKEMNISLVKLGHEQCEQCVAADIHKQHCSTDDNVCQICAEHGKHLRLANISRAAYRDDGEAVQQGHAVLAVDLQKV